MGTVNEREELMKGIFTPVKIRQAVLEDLAPPMSELMRDPEGEREMHLRQPRQLPEK